MKSLFILICVFCSKFSFKDVLFTKEKEQYLCNIEFRNMVEVTGFELYVSESGLTDKHTGIVYSERWGIAKSLEKLTIDLTDKCSMDDKLTYTLFVNVNPKDTKLDIKPFAYHAEKDNFLFFFPNVEEETPLENNERSIKS